MTQAVFAIPGDKDQRTGGYIYDATVLRLLTDIGCPTAHLQLPDTFPDPSPDDVATALDALRSIPAHQPVIVDGLALGALPARDIAHLAAPVIALVHHPLGLETGLAPDHAAALIKCETEVLAHVAHVIVTSPHIAKTLTADFGVAPERITIALPGLAKVTAQPAPVTPPLILSVGLLAPRKGHDTLVDALTLLADLEWQAEIVGRPQDPAYTHALTQKIGQAGLDHRVTLVGEVDASTLGDTYGRASIFALATRYEGYGMVLGEAMMHGLPIVSCAVGAVPGTVGDAAMLVPPDNPQEFARALRTLLTDPDAASRAGRASLARAATLPTWHDTAQTIATVIQRVTPRHASLDTKGI